MSYRRIPQNQQTELTAESRHDELVYEMLVDRRVRTEVAVLQALVAGSATLFPHVEDEKLLPHIVTLAATIAATIIEKAEEKVHGDLYHYNPN